MEIIIGLIILGLILISFELIVPGGILGLLGFAAYVSACALVYQDHGMAAALTTFISIAFITLIVIFLEFKCIPKTKLGSKLFLNLRNESTIEQIQTEDTIIGQDGQTLTILAPSGMISIDGKSYEAFSRDGLIEKNTPVRVVDRDNFRLIVIKSTNL
jgi:membrane-bound ClpP family serine protease